MKKVGVITLLCALGTLMVLGCSEDNLKPYFTRLSTSGACGVAPFPVEFYAVASGGNEFDEPTGANLYLEIDWDFGDGSSLSGSSIAFHTYTVPDSYRVWVTVKDKDGDSDVRDVWIDVRADTLSVWAESLPPASAAVGDTVEFVCYASACGFSPQDPDYRRRFLMRWRLDNAQEIISSQRRFRHVFTSADVGLRRATVSIEDPALSVVRRAAVDIEITQP